MPSLDMLFLPVLAGEMNQNREGLWMGKIKGKIERLEALRTQAGLLFQFTSASKCVSSWI